MDYEEEEAQEWQQVRTSRTQSKKARSTSIVPVVAGPSDAQAPRDGKAKSRAKPGSGAGPSKNSATTSRKIPHKRAQSGPRVDANTLPPRNKDHRKGLQKSWKQDLITEQQRLQDDPHYQKFCRGLPDSSTQSVGTFLWPTDQRPQEKTLDTIRMEECCWITHNPATSMYRVSSSTSVSLKQALCRLRTTFRQLNAYRTETTKLRMNLPVPTAFEDCVVDLVPFGTTGEDRKHAVTIKITKSETLSQEAELAVPSRSSEPLQLEENADITRGSIAAKLGGALSDSLERLKYYKGYIAMKAHYGTFILTSYRPNIKTFPELLTMLEDPQCRYNTSGRIGNPTIEGDLLEKFSKSRQIIKDFPTGTEHPSPVFGTTFQLKSTDPSLGVNAVLFLSVEYEINPQDDLDRVSTQWSMADSYGERQRALDVNIIDFQKSMAWNIFITTGRHIDVNQHRHLLDLDASLDFKLGMDGQESQFRFKLPPTLKIVEMQKRTTYKYRLVDSNYTCEVIRVQESQGGVENIYVYWAVNVNNNEWGAVLSHNVDFDMGESMGGNSIAHLFNSISDVEEFMRSMETVTTIIHGAE